MREDVALAAHAEFVPGHPELSKKISELHARLAHDDHAQSEIDAHLLAAAAAERGVDLGFPLGALVLDPRDAPQFATLPDLGPVIRACLVGRQWNATYLSHCLHCCMPVPRSASKPPPPDPASCAVLFNVLLASLLGLYPSCVKKPPFAVRSQLFARVHALLTAPSDAREAFAAKFKPLFVFALSEYACRLLPLLFPAEREAICAAQAVDAFFAQGPAVFDAFRQDCVDSGREPWRALASAAQEAHDRLSRTYRSKCRQPQAQKKAAPADTPRAVMASALAAPKLVVYPFHRGHAPTLQDEYAILLGTRDLPGVPAVHSIVKTSSLPASIKRQQAISLIFSRDSRRFPWKRQQAICLIFSIVSAGGCT